MARLLAEPLTATRSDYVSRKDMGQEQESMTAKQTPRGCRVLDSCLFFCYFGSLIGFGGLGQIEVSEENFRVFHTILAVKTRSEENFGGVR